MRRSRPVPSRRTLVVLAFMIGALAVSVGSGAALTPPSGSLPHAPSSSCYGNSTACWLIETVDFGAKTNNYVTGIEDGGNLVGASSNNNYVYNSFWADPSPSPTAYPSFAPEDDPTYSNTFLQGLSNNGSQGGAYQVGYAGAVCPSCATVGVIFHGGSWTTIQHPGAGICNVTQVLAINDAQQGVGFYQKLMNGTCQPQAFEFYPDPGGGFDYHDFNPVPPNNQPYLSSTANGINTLGDVVGTVTYGPSSSPHRSAWYYSELGYYSLANGADDTFGRGIDYNDRIVGDYVDTSGTHGFFVKNPEASPPTFVTIDYSTRSPGPVTIINSINTAYSIAGWYLGAGAGSYYHGFVGICTICPNPPAGASRRVRTHAKRVLR